MKNKEDRKFILAISPLLAVLCVLLGVLIYAIWDYPQPPTEIESYSEGYEISHMEISQGRCYISARNDNSAFTIRVDGKEYAQYTEGEIIEVEVRVMEKDERTFNRYFIIGTEE